MKKVTIPRQRLITAITENRDKHNSEFLEAKANYRNTVLVALEARRDAIAGGATINLYFQLPEPQDHTAEYDRALRMLNMSSDEEIELDAHEFDQYVMDNWTWSGAVKAINSTYLNAAR